MSSTYESSRYRTARRPYTCVDCKREIEVGSVYLNFKTGLHSQQHVCDECSTRLIGFGQLKWHCKAVERRRSERVT